VKLGQGFRDQMGGRLGGAVQHEFDQQGSIINTWSKQEHDDNGRHTDVTMRGLTFRGPLYLHEDADVAISLSANTDNLRSPLLDVATVLRISTDASRNLTGLYNPDIGKSRFLLLINVGGFDLVLKHNVTSTEQYRFACPGSVDLTLQSSDSVWVYYDKRSGNWRVIGV
jgi:hypothetical protein